LAILLLPFLNAVDLLRLSECCYGLLPYRLHLSKVMVVPHPWGWDDVAMMALAQLMKEQKGKGLQYLAVQDVQVLEELAGLECVEGLKTLDLTELGRADEDRRCRR
jgi:hypothetical protein